MYVPQCVNPPRIRHSARWRKIPSFLSSLPLCWNWCCQNRLTGVELKALKSRKAGFDRKEFFYFHMRSLSP